MGSEQMTGAGGKVLGKGEHVWCHIPAGTAGGEMEVSKKEVQAAPGYFLESLSAVEWTSEPGSSQLALVSSETREAKLN